MTGILWILYLFEQDSQRSYPAVKFAVVMLLTITMQICYLVLCLTPVVLGRREEKRWKHLLENMDAAYQLSDWMPLFQWVNMSGPALTYPNSWATAKNVPAMETVGPARRLKRTP